MAFQPNLCNTFAFLKPLFFLKSFVNGIVKRLSQKMTANTLSEVFPFIK